MLYAPYRQLSRLLSENGAQYVTQDVAVTANPEICAIRVIQPAGQSLLLASCLRWVDLLLHAVARVLYQIYIPT